MWIPICFPHIFLQPSLQPICGREQNYVNARAKNKKSRSASPIRCAQPTPQHFAHLLLSPITRSFPESSCTSFFCKITNVTACSGYNLHHMSTNAAMRAKTSIYLKFYGRHGLEVHSVLRARDNKNQVQATFCGLFWVLLPSLAM